MSEFLDRVYDIARSRAAQDDVWGAICAVTYADTITLNQAMTGVEGVSIDGKLVAATPTPKTASAQSLVEAMRQVLIAAIPNEHRERVSSLFPEVDFLAEHEAPASTKVQSDSLRKRTEGLKPHAFKARRVSDSRVHARASIKMSEAGVDDVDIHAAIRASDVAVFESTSIEYSLSHADWQLEGHSIRMELADEMVSLIDPGTDKDYLRRALKEQFEGVDFTTEIEWIIA
jgi:hypothetical protein